MLFYKQVIDQTELNQSLDFITLQTQHIFPHIDLLQLGVKVQICELKQPLVSLRLTGFYVRQLNPHEDHTPCLNDVYSRIFPRENIGV